MHRHDPVTVQKKSAPETLILSRDGIDYNSRRGLLDLIDQRTSRDYSGFTRMSLPKPNTMAIAAETQQKV